ncbi:MAG: nucleoside deaminase [Candidatus Margulisiibacteriota bacterium]
MHRISSCSAVLMDINREKEIVKVEIDYLMVALEQAKKAASVGEVPVGAVVVKDGVVIGAGYNLKETDHSPIAHAEIQALQAACKAVGDWRLDGAVLYSTLEPCPMCAGALFQARIAKVVFGAKDLKWGAAGTVVDLFSDAFFNHRIAVVYEPTPECEHILRDFFKQVRTSS